MLGRQIPAVEQLLRESEDDRLAFTAFPTARWQKTWSTNPLERLSQEIERRTDVVGGGTSRLREMSPAPRHCCAWLARSWSGSTDERQVSGHPPPPRGARRPPSA